MDETERELIRRCQGGEKEAFGVLVKRHAGRAIAAAFALLGDHEDALDASQEAFVRAWRGLRRFDGRSSFYTWYAAILRNCCATIRRRKRWGRPSRPPGPSVQADPGLLAEQNERARRVWQAVLDLTVAHREVIVLCHFQQMTYREAAEALDVPIGTVMSRLHHARKALRARLAEEPP